MSRCRWPAPVQSTPTEATESVLTDRQAKLRALDKLIPLIDMGVIDRNDPITALIAKAIVNVTASGERDPKEGMGRALNALGVRTSAMVTSGLVFC
jgi:hypothetical protein